MSMLYIDCSMGAAGDMLTAALYELLDESEKKEFLKTIKEAGIPDVTLDIERTKKCGISGSHFKVLVAGLEEGEEHHHDQGEEHYHDHGDHNHDHEDHRHGGDEHHHDHGDHNYDHEDHRHGGDEGHHDHHEDHDHHGHHHHDHPHHHAGMHDIEQIVNSLKLPEKVKTDIINVYKLIAEAESYVHGEEVTKIHFHEVGMMDAIADIASVCLAMDMIKPAKVIASPVHAGSGQVRCAHGIMPVPAPATAYLLKNIPFYGGSIRGELCTPTGAALLKYFVTSFGNMPVMNVEQIGYGMGKKDFEAANCLRVLKGEADDEKDKVIGLSCNVDDMTGEEVGYAYGKLFEAGALEVLTSQVSMKKSRQGILFNILCKEEDKEELVKAIFKYTTTIGIRETKYDRYVLKREIIEENTSEGPIRRKDSQGYGVSRSKYEYEDLASLADKKNISLRQAQALLP